MFSLFAVVAISLSLSWILGVTVPPMLGYYWLAPKDRREDAKEEGGKAENGEDGRDEASRHSNGGRQDAKQTRENDTEDERNTRDPAFRGAFYDFFRGAVRLSLKVSVLVIVGAAALTFVSILGFGRVEQAFFPNTDTPIGFVDIEARSGADIHLTNERASAVEALSLIHI